MSTNCNSDGKNVITEKMADFMFAVSEFNMFRSNSIRPTVGSLRELDVSLEIKDIPDKECVVHTTLPELEQKLNEVKAYNERARRVNQNIQASDEDKRLMLPLADEAELERLIAENQENQGEITYTHKMERLGYYERDDNGKGHVVMKETDDLLQMKATYLHEMMHAFFDGNHDIPQTDAEYIEEALAEYGALHFLYFFYLANQTKENYVLLKHAYNQVVAKQYCIATEHYGFGAYLFDWYMHVDWEVIMRNAQPICVDGYDLAHDMYEQFKAFLRGGDLQNAARRMLWCVTYTHRNTLEPEESEGHKVLTHNYGWIFRFEAICDEMEKLHIDDAVTLDGWNMESHGVKILFFCSSVFDAIYELEKSCGATPKVTVSGLDVERLDAGEHNVLELEVSFDVQGYNALPERLPWDEITEIRVMDGLKYNFWMMQAKRQIRFTVDGNCKDYRYDKANNVLIDERRQSVIWGIDWSTIPEGIKEIGDFAFSQCKTMTSIELPKGLTKIGRYAFGDCKNLMRINIPESVESVGEEALYGCPLLPRWLLDKAERLKSEPI